MKSNFPTVKAAVILLYTGILCGCSAPPIPPEVSSIEVQEKALWSEGGDLYTPGEYKSYLAAFKGIREHFYAEKAKFVWFRNYVPVRAEIRDLYKNGEELRKNLREEKTGRANTLNRKLSRLRDRIASFKRLASLVNEGRFSRKDITRAEVLLSEADGLYSKGLYLDAEKRVETAFIVADSVLETISPVISRYTNGPQIKKWRDWVDKTLKESRGNRGYAIVVYKIDRSLTLYREGRPYKSYPVGLGLNGTGDKLHAGDRATPEGRYRIVRKLPGSRFYKALLINYPNEEDKRRFIAAKRNGVLPERTRIGGLVEIHGGGKEIMTYGCIAMEDRQIEELYNLVDTGTPVTIVGTVDHENGIHAILKEIKS